MREPDLNFAASEQIKFLFQRNPQQYFQKVKAYAQAKLNSQRHPIRCAQNQSIKDQINNQSFRTHTAQSQKINSLHTSGFDQLHFALLVKQNSSISDHFAEKQFKPKDNASSHKKTLSELSSSRLSSTQKLTKGNLRKLRAIFLQSRQKNQQQQMHQKRDQFSKIVQQQQEHTFRQQKASMFIQSKDTSNDKGKNNTKLILKQQSQLIKIPQIDIQTKNFQIIEDISLQKHYISLNAVFQKVNKQIQQQMSQYQRLEVTLKNTDNQKLKDILITKRQQLLQIIEKLQNLALLLKKKIVQNLIGQTKRLL